MSEEERKTNRKNNHIQLSDLQCHVQASLCGCAERLLPLVVEIIMSHAMRLIAVSLLAFLGQVIARSYKIESFQMCDTCQWMLNELLKLPKNDAKIFYFSHPLCKSSSAPMWCDYFWGQYPVNLPPSTHFERTFWQSTYWCTGRQRHRHCLFEVINVPKTRFCFFLLILRDLS